MVFIIYYQTEFHVMEKSFDPENRSLNDLHDSLSLWTSSYQGNFSTKIVLIQSYKDSLEHVGVYHSLQYQKQQISETFREVRFPSALLHDKSLHTL